jgi:hypothetical protein
MYVHAAHIKRLVEIRQTYKDALIYGRQDYQPDTNHDDVIAYLYRGNKHESGLKSLRTRKQSACPRG